MDILGHNAIRTTMDIYAHVIPETKREAADIMEQILTGKKGQFFLLDSIRFCIKYFERLFLLFLRVAVKVAVKLK